MEELQSRVVEAEEILRAIRCGEVDAFFVANETGSRICAMEGTGSAFRLLVEAMNEGAAILTDAGMVLYCNGRFAEMLRTPLELVMGSSLLRYVSPPEQKSFERLWKRGLNSTCAGEIDFHCVDKTIIPVKLSLSPLQIHQQLSVSVVATDLTYRNGEEEEKARLQRISLTDELTGLANRRGFFFIAQQQIKLARRMKTRMILLYLDLDNLKHINDNLGHTEGDLALTEAAYVLKRTFRESDILSRLGGDEFAVLATVTNERDSQTILERLQLYLDSHNAKSHRSYQLTMSVGVAHYNPNMPVQLEKLLACADAAMYEQKRCKRGTHLALGRNPDLRNRQTGLSAFIKSHRRSRACG